MQATESSSQFMPNGEPVMPSFVELRVVSKADQVALTVDRRIALKYIAFIGVGLACLWLGFVYWSVTRIEPGKTATIQFYAGGLLLYLNFFIVPIIALINTHRTSRAGPLLLFDKSTQELVHAKTQRRLPRDAVASLDAVRVEWPSDGEHQTVAHYVVVRLHVAESIATDIPVHVGVRSAKKAVVSFVKATNLSHRIYTVKPPGRRP